MRSTFLLLSIIVWLNSHAQVYFDNRYDFYGVYETAGSVIELDSGYLVGGWVVRDSATWNGRVGLMSIDKAGNAVWKKSWGDDFQTYSPGTFGSLIATIDGGYAMAVSVTDSLDHDEAMLYKFDRYGDTLWTKRYRDTASETGIDQCRQTSDKGYIAIGTTFPTNNYDVFLMRTDSMGNKLWQRTYGGSGMDWGVTIDICDDGGFILGGYSDSFGGGSDTEHYLIKTDSAGNVQWSKTFGDYLDDYLGIVKQTSDKGYMFAGYIGKYFSGSYTHTQASITKLDTSGNVRWSGNYGPVGIGPGLYAIHELADGSFVSAGTRIDTDASGYPSHPVGVILKVAANGDSLWYRAYEHLYGIDSENSFRHMAPTEDGGFIAAGAMIPSFSSGDTGTLDMWVVKLDSCGCAYAGCDSLCGKTTGLHEADLFGIALKVYPNPFSDHTTIAWRGRPASISEIRLYNIRGQLVRTMRNLSGNAVTVSRGALRAGMYFVEAVTEDGRMGRTRMVVY